MIGMVISGGLEGKCTFSWWVWLTIGIILLCLLASVKFVIVITIIIVVTLVVIILVIIDHLDSS